MSLMTDLVVILTRLLTSVRSLKVAGKGGADGAALEDFRQPLDDIFSALIANTVEYQSDDSHGSHTTVTEGAIIIVRDTLFRLDPPNLELLASDCPTAAESFDRVWSDESVLALESRISWLRAEDQYGSGILQIGTLQVGSRALWTGPLKSHQDCIKAAESENNLHLAEEEIPSHLAAGIRDTLADADKVELLQEFVLKRLTFNNLKEREEEVSRAHQTTFDWVFATPDGAFSASAESNGLVPWLRDDTENQIYWINGKAGSGKSTLMRYIVEHPQTAKLLQQWAGSIPLSVVTFYFWTSGSILQRSQTGLLRSLLYQILDQQRDLIPWALPQLWMASQDTRKRVQMSSTWETAELLQGLLRSFRLASKKVKLCLFIDGLDEFNGGEATIINLLRQLVALSPNVKACVSSRPWAAFEKAFGHKPHILLQDLTLRDMDRFISDQMREHIHARHLVQQEANSFARFKVEMLKRAQGVFLWTTLALRFLLSKVDEDTTLNGMHESLMRLPSDLEDLFEHLLFDGRSPMTLRRQSHVFQIVRARDTVCNFTGDDSARAMTLYQMVLAHGGRLEDIGGNPSKADADGVMEACMAFVEFLAHDCANLLFTTSPDKTYERSHANLFDTAHEMTVHRETTRKIQYLHRTVRDFLEYSSAWATIVANGDSSYDAHQAALLSHILRLRSPLEAPTKHRRLDEWWHDDVVPAMTHARYAASENAETQGFLLDKLNETLDWYWKKKPSDELDTWARNAFATYEERMKHKTPFHHPFLCLAAKFGLADYLHIKLADKKFSYKAGIPLLSHALEFLLDRQKTVYPLSSAKVVSAILESGESPNQPYEDMSKKRQCPWSFALRCVRTGYRRGWMQSYDIRAQGTQRWVRILELMIGHGADCKIAIPKDQWDPEATPLSIISAVVMKYQSADIYLLMQKICEKNIDPARIGRDAHDQALQ